MNENRRSDGSAHLWAIGYDDVSRASQVKDEVTRLGWSETYLILSDAAVVVRHPDGSFIFERERAKTTIESRDSRNYITASKCVQGPERRNFLR